ncbi:phage gpG-like protein [Pedobacter sp. UYEF25]
MSNQDKIDAYFLELQNRIAIARVQIIPILAEDTVNYGLENFAKESFDGLAWAPRKDKKNKRALLVKTGKLKGGLRVIATRANGFNVGVTDVPYAAIHNYGGAINRAASSETFLRNRKKKGKSKGRFTKGTTEGQGFTFKPYTINMPKRQFLGASPILAARLIKAAKAEMYKAIDR